MTPVHPSLSSPASTSPPSQLKAQQLSSHHLSFKDKQRQSYSQEHIQQTVPLSPSTATSRHPVRRQTSSPDLAGAAKAWQSPAIDLPSPFLSARAELYAVNRSKIGRALRGVEWPSCLDVEDDATSLPAATCDSSVTPGTFRSRRDEVTRGTEWTRRLPSASTVPKDWKAPVVFPSEERRGVGERTGRMELRLLPHEDVPLVAVNFYRKQSDASWIHSVRAQVYRGNEAKIATALDIEPLATEAIKPGRRCSSTLERPSERPLDRSGSSKIAAAKFSLSRVASIERYFPSGTSSDVLIEHRNSELDSTASTDGHSTLTSFQAPFQPPSHDLDDVVSSPCTSVPSPRPSSSFVFHVNPKDHTYVLNNTVPNPGQGQGLKRSDTWSQGSLRQDWEGFSQSQEKVCQAETADRPRSAELPPSSVVGLRPLTSFQASARRDQKQQQQWDEKSQQQEQQQGNQHCRTSRWPQPDEMSGSVPVGSSGNVSGSGRGVSGLERAQSLPALPRSRNSLDDFVKHVNVLPTIISRDASMNENYDPVACDGRSLISQDSSVSTFPLSEPSPHSYVLESPGSEVGQQQGGASLRDPIVSAISLPAALLAKLSGSSSLDSPKQKQGMLMENYSQSEGSAQQPLSAVVGDLSDAKQTAASLGIDQPLLSTESAPAVLLESALSSSEEPLPLPPALVAESLAAATPDSARRITSLPSAPRQKSIVPPAVRPSLQPSNSSSSSAAPSNGSFRKFFWPRFGKKVQGVPLPPSPLKGMNAGSPWVPKSSSQLSTSVRSGLPAGRLAAGGVTAGSAPPPPLQRRTSLTKLPCASDRVPSCDDGSEEEVDSRRTTSSGEQPALVSSEYSGDLVLGKKKLRKYQTVSSPSCFRRGTSIGLFKP
eukprot:TRINITY_DN6428_c0_g2_i1.p1 TRINITY_DN6428_c0_g2~~TRINITY_DN6428_c0_g2_i1.p1  ORF type:complete len:882 (-),score=129.09 TRINITY_DN6428_c0_g2_i1:624-3269(-)